MSIVGSDVFHIGDVLESPFDFERADACIYHIPKLLACIEIVERQEVFFFDEQLAVAIVKVVGAAARLRATSTVTTATIKVLAHIALSAVTDTEGAMDEGLELQMGVFSYLAHLIQRGFTGQYYATETCLFQELYAFHRGIVALGAGMQLNGWQIALEQPHVLNEKGIDPDVVELANHLYCIVDFVIEEESVDGYKHLGAIEMGVFYQGFDVLDGIGGGSAGSESRRTDIEGIGAMVDGLAAKFQILGRG